MPCFQSSTAQERRSRNAIPYSGYHAPLTAPEDAEITRWTVPADDESCCMVGWRHFGDAVEPPGLSWGDRALAGHDSLDIYGQSGDGQPSR